MPIDIQPVLVNDLRRCAEIEHDAFAQGPFNKILFPGPMPENFLELRADGLAKEYREDPTVRMFKAVDTDLEGDEAIVAWCKFHSYPEGLPTPKPRVFGPGSNPEACTMLFVGMDNMRERLMVGKPSVYLHVLVTDPKHQRRGAGLQLLTPIMQEAVRLGVPAYLESSLYGHRLYQKAGFKDLEEQRLDMTKYGASEPHLTWAMLWELPNRRCP
ncbi:acetyltransferase [Colletotrichum truncatum]|uniref:Acetyltransferase n=1 Tax=Colletotrichum truncatum TaxID=5467 RepID=A0ACC3YF76_COLTU|nr:acetyltransferase [Colletotrichum truncatum]KAF6788212.1 acetyltransferase [Colletotrichum truncatum]